MIVISYLLEKNSYNTFHQIEFQRMSHCNQSYIIILYNPAYNIAHCMYNTSLYYTIMYKLSTLLKEMGCSVTSRGAPRSQLQRNSVITVMVVLLKLFLGQVIFFLQCTNPCMKQNKYLRIHEVVCIYKDT